MEKELRRRSVTRLLLWEEYRAANPDGFGYTWFCTTFEAWKKRARPTMRQTHMGGEKVFVDFAGDTIDIIDPITGEAHAMKLFVAAMGASNYTYAEACPSESLPDWIGMHANLFRFLGGVPKFVVCDNLKAAVTNPDRYDPGLNRTYAEMASHYGTAILAARPRRPKDKAKVEVAVQIAQRWVGASRNQRFFSLAELNAAIGMLVVELNARQMRGFGASRAELFAEIDSPKLENCRTSHTSLRAGSVAALRPDATRPHHPPAVLLWPRADHVGRCQSSCADRCRRYVFSPEQLLGHPVDCFMRCPLGTISKRSRLEVCLEDRLQYELERPLHHAIPDCRN